MFWLCFCNQALAFVDVQRFLSFQTAFSIICGDYGKGITRKENTALLDYIGFSTSKCSEIIFLFTDFKAPRA
ncbi:hypothetical protein P5673_025363 [Acropora cervicornis]|uniref:Uncharacterized protein n=1 Tax=Acropora cervicornis TaxID=6130 RepID=A0AAD9UXN4_ACRCE|nr:hypothetical protein P5673_025363 [Acropora cervicornis]